MTDDPAGYYAQLDVDPTASAEAITAAFRRRARTLHPDVAGTGDAAAFIRVKEAYDVLGDAERRAAYDRAAGRREGSGSAVPSPARRVGLRPRLSEFPLALWAGVGALVCLASVVAGLQLRHPLPRPLEPSVPSAQPPEIAPAALPASGVTTHYIRPGVGVTLIWRRDPGRDAFLPGGQLGDFAPVEALGLVPQHGLMEIRLADGTTGFVDAERLVPGDRATAHRAYCAYEAGVPPDNGEVLAREGSGGAWLAISNRGSEPAVVKLRDAAGRAVVSVFIAAGATAMVADLPDIAYRPEFAVGELWSRACNAFVAGMRAQRFARDASPSGLSPLLIPPAFSAAAKLADIPDEAFQQE